MKNVFFYPRIGKNYEMTGFNGIKLLILGESHYCDQECEKRKGRKNRMKNICRPCMYFKGITLHRLSHVYSYEHLGK